MLCATTSSPSCFLSRVEIQHFVICIIPEQLTVPRPADHRVKEFLNIFIRENDRELFENDFLLDQIKKPTYLAILSQLMEMLEEDS